MTDQSSKPPTQYPFGFGTERKSSMDLSSLIGTISESRWLVLGLAAAVFVLGVLYSFVRRPVYEANAILQVTQPASSMSDMKQLSSLLQGNALPADTEIELLKTRAVLVPVINKLHLAIRTGGGGRDATVPVFEVPASYQGRRFEIVPQGGQGYRLLGPNGSKLLDGVVGKPATTSIDTRAGKQIVNIRVDAMHAPEGKHIPLERVPTSVAVKNLSRRMRVGELGVRTGVIRVSLQGTSPREIARELNEITKTNVALNIKENSTQAANQLKFVQSQLPGIRKRLDKAQSELAAYLSQNEALALSQNSEYLMQSFATLQQQISPLKAQLAVANASLGPKNPQVQALQRQLQALKSQRKALSAGMRNLPGKEQKLVRLQGNVDISKNLYSSMLNQIQTLQIATAGSVGNVVIVDPAIVPVRAIAPKRALDALVSLVLGLLFGVGVAFARRALRRGVEDPEVLEEDLGLPVYAVLPRSRWQKQHGAREKRGALSGGNGLLAARGVADDVLEGLNSLRTGLQLAMRGLGPHMICIASLGPNEGKSFVSSNLAYLLAKSGKKVLLIDADLRRGNLNKVFGWPRGTGFAEYLDDRASSDEVIRNTVLQNLDVITTGELPKDSGALLIESDVEGKLRTLSAGYEVVIVDIPPILAVSDSLSLARLSTINILLLKHGSHSLRQVQLALSRYERHGIKFSGSILNDVSAGARRYAYRKFGYQYQYQYKSQR